MMLSTGGKNVEVQTTVLPEYLLANKETEVIFPSHHSTYDNNKRWSSEVLNSVVTFGGYLQSTCHIAYI